MNAEKLVALVTELCDNVRNNLLSPGTAADAIASAAAAYQGDKSAAAGQGDRPVDWAGRTFGELTADEKRRVVKAAGEQLSRELQENAPAIIMILDGSYHGLDLERLYEIADIIEQQVLESKPAGHWWTISEILRKGKFEINDRPAVVTTLTWMVENKHAITNGRGGCWVNYGRKH